MIKYKMEKQQVIGVIILIIFSMIVLGFAEMTNPTPIIVTRSLMEASEIAGVNFENSDEISAIAGVSLNNEEIEVEDVIENLEVEINENSDSNVKERSKQIDISRGGHSRMVETKTTEEIAKDVLNGKYGNGVERKERLIIQGYDYEEVQKEVYKLIPKPTHYSENNTQITKSVQSSEVISAHPHSTFKSYMAWTALSPSSPQGKLCAKATKDSNTAIMMYEGRYLVALGKAYTNQIGEKIDVVMENGKVIPVMVGDWKANVDTDQYNSTTKHDGSIIEFIVSSNKEAAKAVNGSGNYNTIFPGKVKEFRK